MFAYLLRRIAVIIPTLIIEVTPVNNQVIKRAAAQASRPHLG